MADTQIVNAQVSAAPLDYVIPPSAELQLKAVSADFDGSASVGAWLPAVEIVSDSGHTVARALDPGSPVAAGGSAEVSWFPGVKASVAATGGLPPFAAASGSAVTVASGAANETPIDFTSGRFVTGDASIFTLDTWTFAGSPPGFVGHRGLGISATGTYAGFFGLQFSDTAVVPYPGDPTTLTVFAEEEGNITVALTDVFTGSWYKRGLVEGTRKHWHVEWMQVFMVEAGGTGTAPIIIGAKQASGVNLIAYPTLYVVQLSTSTFGF